MNGRRAIAPPGCLPLGCFTVLLVLLPFFLADAILSALAKLGLPPLISALVVLGVFVGGLIDIPVYRIEREEWVSTPIVRLFGLGRLPSLERRRRATVIAVNLGGCAVPGAVAFYELGRLAAMGVWPIAAALIAIALDTAVCRLVSRPVPGRGVLMPPLVPAAVAALSGLLLLPETAPAVAFCAGVLGPILGADLLRLRHLGQAYTGMASIGGAGTFDGIVISGLFAVLLA